RAMISHTMGVLHSPCQANEALANALQSLEGCFGVFTLLPEGARDPKGGATEFENWIDSGMRAARLAPKDHRYTLSIPTVPQLLEGLQSMGLPLFIAIGQTSWAEISRIAHSYPSLAILVEGVGHHEYLNIRGCLPWLHETPNLLVPTHNQFLSGGLELMVEEIGEERVFFASNFPVDDPSAGLSLLTLSRISDKAKEKIAHGNLDNLISRVGKGGYFA
ncbi:MAG: amidohydrolase family protein, partial [Candidatus Omnitrophica bacterium]|nr:amidohydrolase family protein [Candidatus Omnitrophota bacterium]